MTGKISSPSAGRCSQPSASSVSSFMSSLCVEDAEERLLLQASETDTETSETAESTQDLSQVWFMSLVINRRL